MGGDSEMVQLKDHEKAQYGSFNVQKQKLISICDAYKKRKYIEDMEIIEELGQTEGVLGALQVDDYTKGISANSLDAREREFGSNYKELPGRSGFCNMVLAALDDFMLKLLIVCAIFSIVVEIGFNINNPEKLKTAWIEGFAILVAVAVVSLVGAWSDYKKEGQFMEQQKLEEDGKIVTCMRDGVEKEIHRNYLKVGDIIKIEGGMNVPVDGICIVGIGVMADESAMTGESDHCSKETVDNCNKRKHEFEQDNKNGDHGPHDVPSPVILSGTQIQTGQGWFVCIVVGDDTCEGQILASLSAKDPEQTPLQIKLDEIAMDIGKLGMYTAILVFHCLLLRNFIEGMIYRSYNMFGLNTVEIAGVEMKCATVLASEDESMQNNADCNGNLLEYIKNYLHYLIVGVTIIVVAVPEGLPLAVMISLAYSVKRMLADQNFVKKLTSCEIMGGANNICSDKTGTLTKNEMTWTDIWAGQTKQIIKKGEVPSSIDMSQHVTSEWTRTLIAQGVSCNTIGTVTNAGATELAMLKFVDKCGVNYEELRKTHVPVQMIRFLFDSSRKRMSTVLELRDSDRNEHGYPRRLHVKGASEIVLETCTHYLDSTGDKKPLDDQMKQQLDMIIKKFATQALRTIGFAYKDLKEGEGGPDHDHKEKDSKIYEIEQGDLTLICIAGIKDIIRDEVPHAVVQCNEAGVRVRMVTGDNKITAIAIAKECGIIKDGEENEDCVCMEGPEFYDYVGGLQYKNGEGVTLFGKYPDREQIVNKKNMKQVRDKLKVLARSRPNDKYVMVAGLKELGDIVAVTGDGTNDAPALKRADVGFAMKTGTSVAHNAAAIIIQDDNFASIVKACMWGRNVYDNIRRFLQFQLTVNVVALITAFIGSVVLWDSPLAAIQLLWVNLIMDSLASLALATELPKDDLLQRPPYRKREYIISQKMVKHILGQSLFQAIILFVFVFAGHTFIPETVEGPQNTDPSNGITAAMIAAHPNESIKEWTGANVLMGLVKDFNGEEYYKPFETKTPSRHLSVVFNLFVWFQIFNMLCARKINDEFNFLDKIHTNAMFLVVWSIIAVGQVLIVQFGSHAMKVHITGLTGTQWVICVAVGAVSIIWNAVLKCVPDRIFPKLGDESEEDVRKSALDYDTLRGIASRNRTTD